MQYRKYLRALEVRKRNPKVYAKPVQIQNANIF